MPDIESEEAWWRRACATADALPEDERERLLTASAFSAFKRREGVFDIVSDHGPFHEEFSSLREAKNAVIIWSHGMLDGTNIPRV